MNKLIVMFGLMLAVSISCPVCGGDIFDAVKFDCNKTDVVKEFGFGNVEKDISQPNSSKTAYRISERYDKYVKQGEGYEQIGFFSALQRSVNYDNPKSIWHIIAIPSETQTQDIIRGNINKQSLEYSVKSGLITDMQKKYLTKRKTYKSLTKENGDKLYYYVHNPSKDTEVRTQIDIIWRELLKNDLIVMAYEKMNGIYYDFWFYHYPVNNESERFNLETGYVIPSTKLIKKRGTVYGFVINGNNQCIGTTELIIE